MFLLNFYNNVILLHIFIKKIKLLFMINKKKCNFFNIFFIFLLFVSSVSSNILVSIKPIGFIAYEISNNLIPMDIILPSNISEHHYLLKPSDIKKIKNTDLLIWIGPDMEKFLVKTSNLLSMSKNLLLSSNKDVQELMLCLKQEFQKECNNGNKDMHLWLSPKIAIKFAFLIYKKLSLIMPDKKNIFFINFKNFQDKLNKIDKLIMNKLKFIKNKKYFLFHNSFNYFEKHYRLSSPIGEFTINNSIQPGIKKIKFLKKKLKNHKNYCFFIEKSYQSKIIDNVFHDINIKKIILDPLGSNIILQKDSYINFLFQLSEQYLKC